LAGLAYSQSCCVVFGEKEKGRGKKIPYHFVDLLIYISIGTNQMTGKMGQSDSVQIKARGAWISTTIFGNIAQPSKEILSSCCQLVPAKPSSQQR
jgi:hypothetical protein